MLFSSLIRFDSLLQLLLPRACLLCRAVTREPHHLCVPCVRELPILSHSCQKCAQFLHASDRRQLICGQCLTDPPPYDTAYALFPYQPPLRRLISGLKFEEQFTHAVFLSQMLKRAVQTSWYQHSPLPDLILPVPLHASRLRERGYNQAAEIAKPVAAALKIPIDHSLIRIKATQPQSTLPASARGPNISRAFHTNQSYAGRHVAIVDDVMTTGHTVTAIAAVLKQHGARRVDVWCCARS